MRVKERVSVHGSEGGGGCMVVVVVNKQQKTQILVAFSFYSHQCIKTRQQT